MQKNETSQELIQNGAVKNLKDLGKTMPDMDHKDWFKKIWRGSALELICDTLLNFYKTDSNKKLAHAIISEELRYVGMSYLETRSGNNMFQVIYTSAKK